MPAELESAACMAQAEVQVAPPAREEVTALATAKKDATLVDQMAKVDSEDDPKYVAEYASDIHLVFQREQGIHAPKPNYMDGQPHVNAKMRGILIDWLIDVHRKYRMQPETLFLAVDLLDRFLDKRETQRKFLQLVGICALLIAGKFEELSAPNIDDYIYVTDKAYSKDEVIRMEASMLMALEFKVCRPTAVHFIGRYQRLCACVQEAQCHLSQYILELTLADYRMVKYAPAHLAAAAVFLSNKLLHRKPAWTPAAVSDTKLTEQMLKECAKEMCGLLEHAEHSHLQAVRKKFSSSKCCEVARWNFRASRGEAAETQCPGAEAAKARASMRSEPLAGVRSQPQAAPLAGYAEAGLVEELKVKREL